MRKAEMQLAIAKCLVNQRLMDESALSNYAISDPEVRKLKLHTQLEMCKLEDLFHHFKKQKLTITSFILKIQFFAMASLNQLQAKVCSENKSPIRKIFSIVYFR